VELTTDRHEAMRGLSASELLVLVVSSVKVIDKEPECHFRFLLLCCLAAASVVYCEQVMHKYLYISYRRLCPTRQSTTRCNGRNRHSSTVSLSSWTQTLSGEQLFVHRSQQLVLLSVAVADQTR